MNELGKKRIEEMDNQNTTQPEENQVADPDSAIQVLRAFAVIPPSGMELFFQIIADEILPEAADDKGKKERGDKPAFNGSKGLHRNRDHHGTRPVDRKPGTGQKTAIDESVIFTEHQCDLHTPTQKRKDKKQ